jgi:hypothetical protein
MVVEYKVSQSVLTQKRRTYVHEIGLCIDTPFFHQIFK